VRAAAAAVGLAVLSGEQDACRSGS
jgi:hypothetical protein